MSDLVTWLRVQLDEDERGVYEWMRPPATGLLTSSLRPIHEWTERAGAERVLREVESKRRILDALPDWLPANPDDDEPEYAYGRARGLFEAIRWLALPYVDRPGYREEWRP